MLSDFGTRIHTPVEKHVTRYWEFFGIRAWMEKTNNKWERGLGRSMVMVTMPIVKQE